MLCAYRSTFCIFFCFAFCRGLGFLFPCQKFRCRFFSCFGFCCRFGFRRCFSFSFCCCTSFVYSFLFRLDARGFFSFQSCGFSLTLGLFLSFPLDASFGQSFRFRFGTSFGCCQFCLYTSRFSLCFQSCCFSLRLGFCSRIKFCLDARSLLFNLQTCYFSFPPDFIFALLLGTCSCFNFRTYSCLCFSFISCRNFLCRLYTRSHMHGVQPLRSFLFGSCLGFRSDQSLLFRLGFSLRPGSCSDLGLQFGFGLSFGCCFGVGPLFGCCNAGFQFGTGNCLRLLFGRQVGTCFFGRICFLLSRNCIGIWRARRCHSAKVQV